MNINNQIIEDNRILYDTVGNIYPPHDKVAIRTETIQNITCHWFTPENPKQQELIIYIHGGGYAIGSFQSHKAMVSHFASGLERTILFVEYSLAPEKPYPAGLNDVLSIYHWAALQFPEYDFYMIGDSAGGGLTIACIYEIYQQNLKPITAVALISPWYNLESDNPSSESRQHLDQILNKEMVQTFAHAYAGNDLSKADPSQLNFESFPPVFVGVGTNEILFDDSINFFDMIYKIQENAQLKIYGGQGHVLTQLDIAGPSPQDLIANINHFFNSIHHV